MKSIVFLFIYVITVIRTQNTQVISCNLTEASGFLIFQILIGSSKQKIFGKINQAKNYSTLSSKFYNADKSSTSRFIQNTAIKYVSRDYKAICFEDIFYLEGESKAIPVKFMLPAHRSRSPTFSEFGLAFRFEDEDYSITHSLKKNKMIEHLSYSITVSNNSPSFHFGGIPKSIIANMQSGKCKVNSNYNKWGCLLSKIVLRNNDGTDDVYHHSTYAFFQTEEEYIAAPLDFYNYLKKTVFLPYINNECEEIINPNQHFLHCQYEILHQLPKVSFVFDNIVLTILMTFKIDEYGYIAIHNNVNQNEHWVFGYRFLMEFQTLFEYDNELITFYSLNGLETQHEFHYSLKEKGDAKVGKKLFLFASAILLIGLVFLLTFGKAKIILKPHEAVVLKRSWN